MEEIKSTLKELRLRGMIDNLERRNKEALANNLSYLQFLALLAQDERDSRSKRAYNKRLRASRLNQSKTLDIFDFNGREEKLKRLMNELASCSFIEAKQKIILLGISGVGKSHLINAIGLKAIEQGYSVLRYDANELVDELITSRRNGTYKEFKDMLTRKVDFLIIDEFAIGDLPMLNAGNRGFPSGGSELLFDIIKGIDENSSLAITSNRDFKDWGAFFPDNTIASAFTDRAVNNAEIYKIVGESYRIRTLRATSNSE